VPALRPFLRSADRHAPQNAAGVERAVVLFQIISLAQVMRSGNRTAGTVDAMIARIEGKVDAALNLITSVEGKVGAAIDRVAAIESKLDAIVQAVQDQRHNTTQDDTVHRDGQFMLAKLKVRAPVHCSRDMR
jgi:hypothetical protein